jgi:NhaP-type Na+/H+ and K+/H+ antiporter
LGFAFRGVHEGGAHAVGHGAGHEGVLSILLDTLRGSIEWGANLDPHLILYVLLPILIFEAAYALDVHVFKKSFLNAFYMAGPGIVTATPMTGGCVIAIYSFGWGLSEWNVDTGNLSLYLAMLFGAVVSATDPVAVVALLKELGASKQLSTLIEGESLLNDGTAIVAFVVLIGAVTGASVFTVGSAVTGFFVVDWSILFWPHAKLPDPPAWPTARRGIRVGFGRGRRAGHQPGPVGCARRSRRLGRG